MFIMYKTTLLYALADIITDDFDYLIDDFVFVLGCSKCLKTFPRDQTNRPDYSGYDDHEWTLRDGDMHKELGEEWRNALNKKSRDYIEFNHGVRFSELFRLPYFDPVKMHLVDPMHNLMLGRLSKSIYCFHFLSRVLEFFSLH